MARVTVDKENHLPVDLHYEDRGTGRPVVLIHGWPLSGEQWEAQVPALLAAGYRVVTYDRRGFGASAKPRGGYDFDTLAADLHMLVEHLDLRDACLVGFSQGAAEAVRYLTRFGDGRVSAAALVSSAGPYLRRTPANPAGFLAEDRLREYIGCLTDDRVRFIHRFVTKFFDDGDALAKRPMRSRIVALAAAASMQGVVQGLAASATTDFRDDLRAVTVPTLVVHGTNDVVLPPEHTGVPVAEAVPGSRLVLLPGAPHGLNVTRAAEFNRELLAFLEG